MTALFQLFRNTRGATMVEYAIVLALIALISIGTISALGSSVNHGFKTVADCMGSGNGNGNGAGGCPNGGAGNGNGNGKGGGGGKP